MRGKLQKNEYGDDILGITPADAGKTVYPAVSARYRWDHPRGCGENCKEPYLQTAMTGSPPQVRGKPTHTRRDRKGERITPAGAGKTSTNAAGKIVVGITAAGAGKTRTATASLFAETDHPRRCGENCQEFIHFCIFIGSPPQVRGKPGGGSGPGDTIGDHPRRCGENPASRAVCRTALGSPPQVRGKLRAD